LDTPVEHAATKPAPAKPAPSEIAQTQTVIPVVTALAEPPVDLLPIPAPPPASDTSIEHLPSRPALSEVVLAEGLLPVGTSVAEAMTSLPRAPAAASGTPVEHAAAKPGPYEIAQIQTVIPVVTALAEPSPDTVSMPAPPPAESATPAEHAAAKPVPAKPAPAKPAPSEIALPEIAQAQTVIPVVTAVLEAPTDALAPASGPEEEKAGPAGIAAGDIPAHGDVAENRSSSTLTGYSDEAAADTTRQSADSPVQEHGATTQHGAAKDAKPITSVVIIGTQVYATRAEAASAGAAASATPVAHPIANEALSESPHAVAAIPAATAAPEAPPAAPEETTTTLAALPPGDAQPASDAKPSNESTELEQVAAAATPPAAAPAPAAASESSPETLPNATTARTDATAGGAYWVQLSAVRSEQATETEWKRLRKLHGDLLGGLSLNVVKADLGARGTFYRIQAGALSEAAAHDLCAELRKGNAQCFVVEP
jgi:hypothetical protein